MNNKNKPKLKMEDSNKSDFIKTLWNKGSNKIILIQFKKMIKNVELKDQLYGIMNKEHILKMIGCDQDYSIYNQIYYIYLL